MGARMTQVVAVEYLTLDGVMENPAWSAPYFDDVVARFQLDNLFDSDALLLGRVTYEGFAAAWPSMADDPAGFGARMNALPKYVATRTLTEPVWNAAFLPGDAADAIAAMKAADEGGTLLLNGSGVLFRSLLTRNLVDELRVMVYPVVVGAGARLFDADAEGSDTGGALHSFELTGSRTSPSGVAILTYRPVPDAAGTIGG